MTLDALDYSWARPDPQQMAAAGIKVVARYLFGDGKGLTDAERRGLHSAGLGVVLNYEASRGNHLLGATQGQIDGAAARGYATELGVPSGVPIYFSCDLEVSAGQMPTVLAYLRAADSAAHPSRAYGQAAVCDAYGRPAWQTIAWSYGRMSRNAVLYQYLIEQDFHGSAVDYDTILNLDDLGAWWPEGSEHAMPTADEIADAVWGRDLTDGTLSQPASSWLKQARNNSDRKALVALLLSKLPDDAGVGLTKVQVKAAADAALDDFFGKAVAP